MAGKVLHCMTRRTKIIKILRIKYNNNSNPNASITTLKFTPHFTTVTSLNNY